MRWALGAIGLAAMLAAAAANAGTCRGVPLKYRLECGMTAGAVVVEDVMSSLWGEMVWGEDNWG